jgi:hypothetical protein
VLSFCGLLLDSELHGRLLADFRDCKSQYKYWLDINWSKSYLNLWKLQLSQITMKAGIQQVCHLKSLGASRDCSLQILEPVLKLVHKSERQLSKSEEEQLYSRFSLSIWACHPVWYRRRDWKLVTEATGCAITPCISANRGWLEQLTSPCV